jgi:hypothetical protein
MNFIRKHFLPVLHNTLGNLLTAGLLALLAAAASLLPPVRAALLTVANAPIPFWVAAAVVCVGAFTYEVICRHRVSRSVQAPPAEPEPASDYLQTETRAEMQRKEKIIKDQLQEVRQLNGYIALLEGRLNEKGIGLPRRPPAPPSVISL